MLITAGLTHSAVAHVGSGSTTVVVTIEINPDGTWRATIGLDGRALTHAIPPRLFSDAQYEAVAIAHDDDADPDRQRETLLRFYLSLITLQFDDQKSQQPWNNGADPSLAGRDDLPDHRWGLITLTGRVPARSTSVRLGKRGHFFSRSPSSPSAPMVRNTAN